MNNRVDFPYQFEIPSTDKVTRSEYIFIPWWVGGGGGGGDVCSSSDFFRTELKAE